ncbi:hypothetical protein [Clostridium sp.]|uniref:hypothetical protein n=1 Tax=Clostridium sp. TaxID=1506 RepID=UPI00321697DB
MEKMNLTFEVDGRELAKVIMKERLETVNKRREMMNEVRRDLRIILNCKVLWSYLDDYFQFNIYNEEKQNDYKIITVKRFENEEELSEKTLCSVTMLYVREVYKKYTCKDYEIHKASILEKTIIDMLEECKEDNDFYIMNGLLCHQGADLFDLEDIEEYHVYTGEDMILTLYEDGVKYLILFNENRVEEVE